MLVTGFLKNWELDETCDKVNISAKAKFLTVLMVTFHDNKQALYNIFQYVLTTLNSPQNSITITIQAKLLWTLETAKEAKLTLSSSQHMRIVSGWNAICLLENLRTSKHFKYYFTVTEGFSFLCYCFTKIEAQFSPSWVSFLQRDIILFPLAMTC